MDAIDLAAFNEAVRLAQSGQSAYAYDNLNRLSELYPHDTSVLLWLAFTAPDPYISQQAIARIEQIEPHNPSLLAAKQWLSQLENTLPLATSVARAGTVPATPEPRSPQPQQAWEANHASAQTMQAVPVATENSAVEAANSFLATPAIAIVRIPPPIVIGQPPVLPPAARSTESIPPAKPGRGKRKR